MRVGTVLLTGASGLLGTWLRRTAPVGVEVVPLTHRRRLGGIGELTVDLREPSAVIDAVHDVQPSLVIHTAYAHDEASIVDATQHVVAAANAGGATVLFVSTDAVFSGDGTPVAHHAAPAPVSDYGRWKAHAERIVSAQAERSAIVRLPLIVSLDPADHVVAHIRVTAARGERTTWFDDEMRQPAAAPELADALWRIARLGPDERAGTWHLPGPETLSRYEIAQRVIAVLGLEASAIRAEHTPSSAHRPRHLDLRASRARDRIDWSPSKILGGGASAP